MGDKKHIDRLFQEHFKDFEVKPDAAIWSNIEAKLLNKKKKRRLIPIWWRYAGVAAILLLALSIGTIFINTNKSTTTNSKIVDTKVIEIKNDTIPNTKKHNSISRTVIKHKHGVSVDTLTNIKKSSQRIYKTNRAASKISNNRNSRATIKNKNSISSKTNTLAVSQKSTILKSKIEKIDNSAIPKTSIVNNLNLDKKQFIKSDTLITVQNNKFVSNTQSKTLNKSNQIKEKQNRVNLLNKIDSTSMEVAITEHKSLLTQEDTKVSTNKWSITPNIAPVYFNSLGKGSSIDAQFNNNTTTGEVNMSYGINASYALSKKLKVRSGINRVNLSYNTNNVIAFSIINASVNSATLNRLSSTASDNIGEIKAITAENGISIMSASSFNSSDSALLSSSNTSINQSFGFIEIPLELQYAVLTRRVGVNIIGGFSSLFLSNYNAFSSINGQQTRLQETDNINNTSYSANVGIGIHYKISKMINFNLEPIFKYQINTFRNTSGEFQPFFVGVYSGFGIRF